VTRPRTPRSPWAALPVVAAGAACVALSVALVAHGMGQVTRAGVLAGGFLLLAAALAGVSPRHLTPAAIAGFFVAYGGLSAIVAADLPSRDSPPYEGALVEMQRLGVAFFVRERPADLPHAAFAYTVGLVIAVALSAVVGSLAAGMIRRRRAAAPPAEPSLRALRLLAYVFVAIGVVGLVLAAARLATGGGGTSWETARSLWHGGAYFVLLAHFALPGFGLLIACLLHEGAPRRHVAWAVAATIAFVALTVPSGQRTFAVEAAIVLLALWIGRRGVRPRQVAVIAMLGACFLVTTQVARYSVQSSGRVDPSYFKLLEKPESALRMLGNQFDAFQRSVDVAAYRDEIDAPNSLVAVAAKPVPRQLLPSKPDGFAGEFTQSVYPYVAEQDVSLAVPLWAELDYDFGPVATVLAFLLLGLGLGYAERRVRAAHPVLRPLLAVALFWTGFVLMRGDLSNAVVGAASWLIPAAAIVLVARGSATGLPLPGPPRRTQLAA
jgi:hypothetical protein